MKYEIWNTVTKCDRLLHTTWPINRGEHSRNMTGAEMWTLMCANCGGSFDVFYLEVRGWYLSGGRHLNMFVSRNVMFQNLLL